MTIIETHQIGEGQTLYKLQILEDNYTYILTWDNNALAVDPGDAAPILELLEKENLKLINILITHHHSDHTGGVETLVKKTECHVIGPDDDRIPVLEQSVDEEEELVFGPFEIKVLSTPGHTQPHVNYYFPPQKILFTGDLIFAGGCGKVFEGTFQEMWSSIEKVLRLPDDTMIYCGHEYTEKNLEFARSVEPNNQALIKRLAMVKKLRQEGKSTIPTSLKGEKETNPFLRVTNPDLQQALDASDSDPATIFEHLRHLKDKFQ